MTLEQALQLIELGAQEVSAFTPGSQAGQIADISAQLLVLIIQQVHVYSQMTNQPIEDVLAKITFENPDPNKE